MNTMPTSLVITLLMLSIDGTTWQGLLSGSSHSCSSATSDSEQSDIEAKHLFENIWRISDFQGVYKPCFLEKTIEVEGSTDVETGTGKSKIRVLWPSFWIEASSLSSNCLTKLSDVKYVKPHHSAANPRLMNVMLNEKWKWEEDQNENLIQSQTIL